MRLPPPPPPPLLPIKINSIFGTYKYAKTIPNKIKVDYNEYVDENYFVESGLKKEIIRNINVSNNFNETDREYFLTQKKTDLIRIAQELRDFFKEEYKRNLQRGFSQNDAEQYARETIEKEKKKLLDIHNEKYIILN